MKEFGYILTMSVTYGLTDLLTKENPEMLSHLKTIFKMLKVHLTVVTVRVWKFYVETLLW